MDEPFETEVMQDLAEGYSPASADGFDEADVEDRFTDEGFDEDAGDEDGGWEGAEAFDEGDDAHLDEDAYDDGFTDEFAEDLAEDDLGVEADAIDVDLADELEEVLADALDAEDSDDFLGRLISGIRRVAGLVGRGAGAAGRVADTVGRIAGQAGQVARGVQGMTREIRGVTRPQPRRGRPRRGAAGRRPPRAGAAPQSGLPDILRQLLPLLQQQAAQGANEYELFEDLADWFEDEGVDAALPVLAGIAARAAVRPLARRTATRIGRAAGRQIVRGATQAARTLVSHIGPGAVRALPRIAESVGRIAARRGLRPAGLAPAVRRAASQVAASPALARRLARPVTAASGMRGAPPPPCPHCGQQADVAASPVRGVTWAGTRRRLIVRGPVEIIVRR